MRIFYATKEGGDLYPLDVSASKEELIQDLETKRMQVLASPERGMSLFVSLFKPSKLTQCSHIDDLEVFCVLFPDATIWDSILGRDNLRGWGEEILEACQEKYS